MKKIIFFSFALLTSSGLFAQLHFGPKIGFSTATLTSDLSQISNEFKTNFLFGAFVRVGDKFYLQPEINWVTTGGVYQNPSLQNGLKPFKQEISLNTVQIPALLGWQFLDLKVLSIRAFLGPSANFVTNKNIKSTESAGFIAPITNDDISDILWNGHIGLGVDILMLAVDVQYFFSLNNAVADFTTDEGSFSTNGKNTGFYVSVGWKIF